MAQSPNGIPSTNNSINSITRQAKTEPFELQVARGQIYGHSVLNIYGYQTAVGTSFVPVWEGNSSYTFPSSAIQMHIVSSVNTGDDKTATFVTINGLDANYNQISETIKLNGTTTVTTVKSYFRINSMAVSSGAPTGNITLKDTSDTTLYAEIAAGNGRTLMGIYTVPAGYTFYLSRIDINTSLNANPAGFATYQNYQTSNTGVSTVTIIAPFTNNYHTQRVMPRLVAEKTDIQLQSKVSIGTAALTVSQEGYLIANGS